MAIQTTTLLDSAVGTRYTTRYVRAAVPVRLYDQLAIGVTAPQFEIETRRGQGTTYTFNFASDMQIGTTAISQTADIVPQTLIDATSTITPTSLGEAIKWSQIVDIQAYTDFVALRAEKVGENAMESIDWQARTAALAGTLQVPGTARASLNAGTSGDRFDEAAMWEAAGMIATLKCPPLLSANGKRSLVAIYHPDAHYDLFHSGNVNSAIIYGGLPGEMLLNGEIGEIMGFKLVVSPWAHVFGGAGADNSTGSSQTYVLSANSDALATSVSVTTGTNVAYGRFITLGTEETSTTLYPTNERVRRVSGTTTMTLIGSAANGGTRFPHLTTEYALNADSVYPVVFGGPESLVKVFASDVGEFGQLVGPLEDGLAHQWQSLAWKWFGGYGRVAENRILRGEYSSSLDA
jgi:N4-gp56 family major capsid protein